jgi:excisionase family DNA binding protein
MKVAIGNWMSVNEAAEILGLTTGRIRQLLIGEELPGKKLNKKAWVIDRRDIERFAKENGKILQSRQAG